MFASTFLSRLTSSTPQPLLPASSSHSLPQTPYTDIPAPSPTDTTATLLALARQEAHLQSHIQYLLDVQSDRLLEGLGGTEDTASSKPRPSNPNTAHDHHASSKAATTQTPPTLQGARRQIGKAISDLHALKQQNADIVAADLDRARDEGKRVTVIRTKRTRLEATIRELEAEPESLELDKLAIEEESLGHEIQGLENRLMELRARREDVRRRLQEGRNRREARVSSWRGSLEILAREEGEVVGRKLALVEGTGKGKGKGKEGGKGESVWDLPIKRRTLAMVGEFHERESEALKRRLEGVELESRALEEGGRVWEDVVGEVGMVERMLEGEMKGLADSGNGDGSDGEERRIDGMKRVLKTMARVRETVGAKLKMAEEKGWNLLVVCVGAELEALMEGEEVLRSVLEVQGGSEHSQRDVGMDGVNGSSRGAEQQMTGAKSMVEDTEDDEPGPELLLSTRE
ncbi:MAG: hypothetical protein Q9221_005315 [Calogaya cf. arnoldii]